MGTQSCESKDIKDVELCHIPAHQILPNRKPKFKQAKLVMDQSVQWANHHWICSDQQWHMALVAA